MDVANIRLHSTEIHLFQKTPILISTVQQNAHLVTAEIQTCIFFNSIIERYRFLPVTVIQANNANVQQSQPPYAKTLRQATTRRERQIRS